MLLAICPSLFARHPCVKTSQLTVVFVFGGLFVLPADDRVPVRSNTAGAGQQAGVVPCALAGSVMQSSGLVGLSHNFSMAAVQSASCPDVPLPFVGVTAV